MGHLTTSIFSDGVNSSHVVVHVFFGNQVYRRLRRDLLSHFVILIGTRTHLDQYCVPYWRFASLSGNFGGVFSLFIGMSLVSFFELGIYFTVYLYRNYQQELRNSVKVESFSRRALDYDQKIFKQPAIRF